MKSKSAYKLIFILVMVVLVLTSCAEREVVDECLTGHEYGFLGGLWHGIIAPIDLVIMLFNDEVTVFAQNNNGAWYALGFLIGSGGWGIMGGNRACKKKRN